ncbi:MAG: hypothetical protein ACTSXU_08620 [Promethearchaeota archaeon]
MDVNVLFSIFLGMFIGGMIISVVLIVLLGFSIANAQEVDNASEGSENFIEDGTDHDLDHDAGDGFDHDLDHDAGDGFDHDLDHDAGDGFDHDVISESNNVGFHVHLDTGDVGLSGADGLLFSDKGQRSPLLLRVSMFSMLSGLLGISFFNQLKMNAIILLLVAFIPPLFINKIVNKAWRRLTVSETYLLPSSIPLIGRKAKVVIPVDIDGGVVRIEFNTPLGYQRIAVLPYDPSKVFNQGEDVYICGFGKRDGKEFYLIDDKIRNVKGM